jgi:hypothetical protein
MWCAEISDGERVRCLPGGVADGTDGTRLSEADADIFKRGIGCIVVPNKTGHSPGQAGELRIGELTELGVGEGHPEMCAIVDGYRHAGCLELGGQALLKDEEILQVTAGEGESDQSKEE